MSNEEFGGLKPFRKGPLEEVIVKKMDAARAQLEAAISLWFHDGHPVAIHTLAVAAHDCLNALVSNATGKPSYLESWIKRKSKAEQEKWRLSQNFFKHGFKNLKGTLRHPTIEGELRLMDGAACWDLLNKPIALTRLFATRFLYEHPYLIAKEALPLFTKNVEVHRLGDSTRYEFFQQLLPIFRNMYPG